MPAATEALSEPMASRCMGMCKSASQRFCTMRRSPLPSLPMTRAQGWVKSAVRQGLHALGVESGDEKPTGRGFLQGLLQVVNSADG